MPHITALLHDSDQTQLLVSKRAVFYLAKPRLFFIKFIRTYQFFIAFFILL